MKFRGMLGFVYFVYILSSWSPQVVAYSVFQEWSTWVVDFVKENTPARIFLSGREPVTTPQLINLHGYPCETHNVTTEDGYILELHRIPYSPRPKRPLPKQRIPVIVIHGVFSSSSDMVANPDVEDCLGLHLADSGYDVFLGNVRGTTYSKRHVSLTAGDSKFWEYSVTEMGVYDMAAIVDYILLTTSQRKVHHVGISLGGPALMVLLAKRPEYNQKIGVGVFLAPGGSYLSRSLSRVAPLLGHLVPLLNTFNEITGGFPAISYFMSSLSRRIFPVICHPRVDWFGMCRKALYSFYRNDGGLISKEKMPLIMSLIPSPLSFRTIVHIFQDLTSEQFVEFDHGVGKNLQIYGQPNPPPYNLSNVQVPISIFVGPNDIFSDQRQDNPRLVRSLPNVVDFYTVPHPLFTHVDFTFARGVGQLVYKRVVNVLDIFSV